MKNYLITLLLLFPLSVFSQQIDESTAKAVAKNFLTEKHNILQKKAVQEITFKDIPTRLSGKDFFIFNLTGKGFIIVSASKKTYPVLAYSFENQFPLENLPPEVKEWLDIYDLQIKQANRLKISVSDKVIQAWDKYSSENFTVNTFKTNLKSVSPLISTTWNQGIYYNALCPETSTGGSGGHVWAGCVATAMSQLMKYWSYPDYGEGTHSYVHPDYGEQSADFENTFYDWVNMPNSLSSHNIDVATIIYHSGVAVNMDYSPSGSGAYSSSARNAFINYFKYSTNTLLTSKYSYSDENWKKMLRNEIDAGRPLYYAGYGTGGHAFNCDGYQDTDYFHFNWGWGGSYNGYYYLDDLTPGSSNFTNSQSAMVGLQPRTMDSKFDSTAAIQLTCSVSYSGTTTDGSNIANIYSTTSTHETGKEKIHKITSLYPGRITAKLSGMTENLDVFILKYADRNTALAWGDSIAYIDDTEPGTYYIVVDGRYGAEGNYTLTVTCPDNRADLIVENASVEPMFVSPGQTFFLDYQIRNIGNSDAPSSVTKYYLSFDQALSNDDIFIDSSSVGEVMKKNTLNISEELIMPSIDTNSLMYVIVYVDANDDIDEADDELNFTSTYVQIPKPGIMDCANAIALQDGVVYRGDAAVNGDSLIDNYSCFPNLTNKEVIHSFTPEYSGLAKIEFSESLEGSTYVLLLSSCNENACINTFGIWEPGDTVITTTFPVHGGVTYYLVVDGNDDRGNSEGAYSIKIDFPKECPEPVIYAGSSVDKCDGDYGAYLYTDWGYSNYQWMKNGVDIPDATSTGYLAEETGLYSVKVSENGCSGSSEGTQVTYSPKPTAATITALSDTTFCEGGSVVLQLSTGNGYTYQWTNNDIPVEGANDLDYEAFETGVYRAEVTNISCTIKSNPVTVTAYHSARQPGDYLDMSTDSLISWWPFDNWGTDESGNENYMALIAYTTKDRFGSISAYGFNGTDNYAYTFQKFEHPDTFTVSLWFKTSSSGKLFGFDEQRFATASNNFDRHIYIDNSGRLHFGVDDGTQKVISSTLAYNDNLWHFVTASLSPNGMKLYVDAQLVAQDATVTSGKVYSGYWKAAQGSLSGWTNDPGTEFFKGILDDISIYKRELSLNEIEVLYERQILDIYIEDEVICSATGNTNIVIENSEPDIEYQLINAADNSLVGSAVAGNAGTINLNTGTLSQTTDFKIHASNIKTLCETDIDSIFTVYVDTTVVPLAEIVSNKPGNEACVGDTVVFTANTQFEGNAPVYLWQVNGQDAGAGKTFTTDSLTNGSVIKLYLTSSVSCASPKDVSDELTFTIHNLPDNSLYQDGTTKLCAGDSTILSANANADYEWYLIGSPYRLDTTQSFAVHEAGAYYVKLINEFGCVNYSDTVEFSLFPLPELDLGSDTTISTAQSIEIGTEDNFIEYLWNTGATSNTIMVEGNIGVGAHEYWLQVNDGQCVNSDTIVITIEQATGMEQMFSQAILKIYPNPADEFIVIELNSILQENLYIELHNSAGTLILQKTYDKNTPFIKDKIRLKNYPKGLYFLNFRNKTNSLTRKIVIE